MKDYLYQFLKQCQFPGDDCEFLINTYEKIAVHPDASALWERAVSIYNENVNGDFHEILSLADRAGSLLDIHPYTSELLIFLCLTRRLREEYENRDMDIAVFENTVLDLRYKTEECKLVKGIVGTFVAEWFFKFFDMTRFTLGRLQFQIIEFGHHYEKDGILLTPQTKVIDVHIPRSLQPLDEASCDEAFALAKAFFSDEIGEICVFVCHSWLLYPEHESMLSHESNVYRFMKRFHIVKSGINHRKSDLWRLFDTDEKNPEKLPADTTMRRAYVNHLKNGGNVGWGFGIFLLR